MLFVSAISPVGTIYRIETADRHGPSACVPGKWGVVMALKVDPERVWEKDGWELWMKKQSGYVELHIKRPQKDFRIHSGRMGQHGVQVRFRQEKQQD